MTQNFRYIRLADALAERIRTGDFVIGEKLPSIRKLHRQSGLSISTVYQAMIELEKRNLVETRPRSGFYATSPAGEAPGLPSPGKRPVSPSRVTVNDLFSSMVTAMGDETLIQLGGAAPAPELLPAKRITRAIRAAAAGDLRGVLTYDQPQGDIGLRREIAKWTAVTGGGIPAEEIVITGGCMEALALCLRAVTRPGDTVVVESPCFQGFLQIMEDLGLSALAIPAHPETGIDPDALAAALEKETVSACLLTPIVHNPLGFVMPEKSKKRLVELMNGKGIPIIEDGVYNDLFFGDVPPTSLHAYDEKGLVLHCSSFSKTLAPGLRVGWVAPGKYIDKIRRLKLNTAITSPGLNQQVVCDCLKTGFYGRHLRKMRNGLKVQMSRMTLAIAEHFPAETKISSPKGGLLLWVQLPEGVDGLALFRAALEQGIAIIPGLMCASGGGFENCIRLNCGFPPSGEIDTGIRTLGEIAAKMMKEPPAFLPGNSSVFERGKSNN